MPENNNNNNGNNINNGYNNTSQNSNNSFSEMINKLSTLSDSVNKLVDAISKGTSGKGNNNLDERLITASVKSALKDHEKSDQTLKTLKSLEKLQSSKDKNDKEQYASISKFLGEDLEKFQALSNKYQDIIKETYRAQKEIETKSIRAIELSAKQNLTKDEDNELKTLSAELKTLASDLSDYSTELTSLNSKLNTDDMKSIAHIVDIADNTKEQIKEAKKYSKQRRARDAKEDQLYKKLASDFEGALSGGLFELGNTLGGSLDKVRNDALNHLSEQGFLGKFLNFGLKTLNTAIDYQTQNLVKGVQDLQNSFETTGISISQAILLDKDDVAEMYGSWAEELKEQGYEVAMTATDAAQLANSFANAGITDPEMLKEITMEAMKSAAISGSSVTDFTDKEFLTNLAAAMRSGEIDDLGAFFENYTTWVTQATSASGGIPYSQGQLQSFLNNLLNDTLAYGQDRATETFQADLAFKGAATEFGVTSFADNIIQSVRTTKERGINLDSALDALAGYGLSGDLKNASTEDIYKAYLGVLKDYENLDETTRDYLISNVFGQSGIDFEKIINQGGMDALIEELENNLKVITESTEEYERRANLVKAGGTTTTEKQLQNRAQNAVTNQWVEAERSHIPQAADMLAEGIELAGKGVETAIAVGVDLLVSSLMGNGGFGGLSTLLTSGTSSFGTLRKAGTVGAAVASFGVGWEIGTALDKKFGWSNAISSWLAGDVVPPEEEKILLEKIKSENEEQNREIRENISSSLATTVTKLTEIASNVEDVKAYTDNIAEKTTDVEDTRQAIATQLTEYQKHGKLGYTEDAVYDPDLPNIQNLDFGSMSYDELMSYLPKLQANTTNRDMSEEEVTNVNSGLNELRTMGNTAITDFTNAVLGEPTSNLVSDGITTEEWTQLKKAMVESANQLNDQSAGAGYYAYEERWGNVEKAKDRYNALVVLKDILLQAQSIDSPYALQKLYGALSMKDLKQMIIDMNAEELSAWITRHSGIHSYISPEHLEGINDYIDTDAKVTSDSLKLIASDYYFNLFQPDYVTPLATGMNYVPYDNYPALLHRGERVETAAEARLEDLVDDIRDGLTYTNLSDYNDYTEQIDTTNSSIENGFNATADNQTVIIEALRVIINSLNGSGKYNDLFSELSENTVASRSYNMAAIASLH